MEEFILKIKENKIFSLGLLSLFLLVLISDVFIYYYLKFEINKESEELIVQEEPLKEEKIFKVVVEIKGEVINPGVYEVISTKRVNDVIKLAGGLTKNASTKINNLSKKVQDEMIIKIYSNDEITNFLKTQEQEELLVDKCNSDCKTTINACIEQEETTSTLVNINTASKEELMNLPGVGESKAIAIISYREKKKFSDISQIKEVPGIKESIYAQIENLITT